MTELEALQKRMNELEDLVALHVFLKGCNACALNGNKKAASGMLQMAITFYGIEAVADIIKNNENLKSLRKILKKEVNKIL